jgi:hypothetical protein
METLGRRVAGTERSGELERHPHPVAPRSVATRRVAPVRPGGSAKKGGSAKNGDSTRRGSSATFRLTARGAVLGLFVACFLALLLADATGWSAIADMAFVGGCGGGAWYTKRGAMLPLAVSPPLVFFLACLLVQWLTAPGGLALLTGIFLALGTSAPWLFLGTALTVAIGLYRGLGGEVVDLLIDLRDLVTGRLAASCRCRPLAAADR